MLWSTVLAMAMLAAGQTANPPRFDVVSITPQPRTFDWQDHKSGSPGPLFPGGKYINPQAVLAGLIIFAYPQFVTRDRLVGLPEWAYVSSPDGPFYSVDAEAAPHTEPTIAQMRQMMGSLLANRFQLKFHVVSRTMAVWFLQAASRGTPSIQPSAAGERYSLPRIVLDGGGIEARAAPMADLADFLAEIFQQPVIDQTGMPGLYDMNVTPGFDSGQAPIVAVLDTLKRLGLQLTTGKSAVSIMVVDHVERPSPN